MSKLSKITIAVVAVALVAISFGAGFTTGLSQISRWDEGLDKVAEAWHIIRTEHVDREQITSENLSRAAIEGMLDSLHDPYAAYLGPDQFELGQSSLEGSFSGIGAYVNVVDGELQIIAPIAGSPAEAAGIKAGDAILEIDGEPVGDMSMAAAIMKIRGPEGTPVDILVRHEGEDEPVLITVTRASIDVPSVTLDYEGNLAHIRISEFTERTGTEMEPIIQEITANNTAGIVLDLSHNPGGLLDTVIEVASQFIHEGAVIQTRDYKGDMETLYVETGWPVTDLPMVVLVDRASASGSEVLSGALQAHGRAAVAGNTTFGKGSVNILRRLSDGSGIYITIARWLTPDGRLIEGKGIEPDYKLEDMTPEEALDWAYGYLRDIIKEE